MKYSVALIGGFIVAFVLCMTSHAEAQNTPDVKLAQVHKIYIDSLGNQEGDDLVREKIRLRLFKSDRFSVVERPEAADAVLTGAAGVVRSYDVDKGDGGTRFRGAGVLRLVDTKTEETVWVFEYKRGFMLAGSVSSRVADQVVDKLLKDATPPAPKKGKKS